MSAHNRGRMTKLTFLTDFADTRESSEHKIQIDPIVQESASSSTSYDQVDEDDDGPLYFTCKRRSIVSQTTPPVSERQRRRTFPVLFLNIFLQRQGWERRPSVCCENRFYSSIPKLSPLCAWTLRACDKEKDSEFIKRVLNGHDPSWPSRSLREKRQQVSWRLFHEPQGHSNLRDTYPGRSWIPALGRYAAATEFVKTFAKKFYLRDTYDNDLSLVQLVKDWNWSAELFWMKNRLWSWVGSWLCLRSKVNGWAQSS